MLISGACGSSTGDSAQDAAQSSGEPTGLAFEDPEETTRQTLIESAPILQLGEDDNRLVAFEASWICELQRRTFPSTSAIDDALGTKLTETGLDRDSYEMFRIRVNTEQDLRDSILYTYQETCRP